MHCFRESKKQVDVSLLPSKNHSQAIRSFLNRKKHIKERPDCLRILDKLEVKKTEVAIETWEGMCDSDEALINAGQMVCEQSWSDSKNLLTYLSLPVMDLINEAPSHQLHLEIVEK